MFLVTYFAFLLEHIGHSFERAERNRRDAYLAEARDIAELELRMRALERDGYPQQCDGEWVRSSRSSPWRNSD